VEIGQLLLRPCRIKQRHLGAESPPQRFRRTSPYWLKLHPALERRFSCSSDLVLCLHRSVGQYALVVGSRWFSDKPEAIDGRTIANPYTKSW